MEIDPEILEDAKKYMFAEDLISYFIILHGFPADFKKEIAGQYRRLIPRAFNEVIQISTCFLYCRISVFNTFRSFNVNDRIRIGTFLLFAQQLENRYFSTNSINPQRFLYFCTHLAYMAKSFYANGEKDIPKIAANYIAKTMKMYKTPEAEFWNGLNIAAFKYLKMALECGFIKVSVLESVKIQFVIYGAPETEENISENKVIEDNSIISKNESDLLNISNKLKNNLSVADENSGYYGNNQNRTGIEKLSAIHKENFNKDILSDSSSTETYKQNLDLGKKKLQRSNRTERKCIVESTIKEMKQKSKRGKLALKIINGFTSKTENVVSPKKKDQVDCTKNEEKKENEINMTYPATGSEINSPIKTELVNCSEMQHNAHELNISYPGTRTEKKVSIKNEEQVICPKIEQKNDEFKMTHTETGTEVNVSQQINCDKMEVKENQYKAAGTSNNQCCVENKLDEVQYSSKGKVSFFENNYANKSAFESNIVRNEVKCAIENEGTALHDTECLFNGNIESNAKDSVIKINKVEQFDKPKDDLLNNIQKEKSLKISTNSVTEVNFVMNDSYAIHNAEEDEISSKINFPKKDLLNLDDFATNEKEDNEQYSGYFNKDIYVRNGDDDDFDETTQKIEDKNDIGNNEKILHKLYHLAESNQTNCISKFLDKFIQNKTTNMESSTDIDGLKSTCNITSKKYDETQVRLSEQDFNSQSATPAPTTVTYSQRILPCMTEKIDDRLPLNEINTEFPNSALKNFLSRTVSKELAKDEKHFSEKSENGKKSETKNSRMMTLDFDICDEFVIDIVTNADELKLFGETHANFMNKEDYFNSTFDILSIIHYMASNYDNGYLDIEILD